ncbi:hypothetical protein ACLB2K_012928 [Fragaria x ananassa]
MPPHPPLHPRLRQGPGASELVTSMKSTSIKSSQLVIVAAINQVLHHFTSALPQGSATEREPLALRRVALGPQLPIPMKSMSKIMKGQWMDCKIESIC